MNSIEKTNIYHDNYPLLNLRKKILLISAYVSNTSLIISKLTLFEAVTMLIILINSYFFYKE